MLFVCWCSLFGVCCLLVSVVGCNLLRVVYCVLSVVRCFGIRCSLSVVRCMSSVVCRFFLLTVTFVFAVVCWCLCDACRYVLLLVDC